jgi:hypothetical protein
MATGGGTSRFLAIPGGGAGRGATARATQRDGEPIWGQREEGCSQVRLSTAAWVNGGERRR